MTYPRAHLVDAENGGFYHCMSRCVRRAWLCGRDRVSGRSYEHRKGWVKRRLRTLDKAFSVDLYAYAVMSNHYHLVVHMKPQATHTWSDQEVARRWLKLKGPRNRAAARRLRKAFLQDPERIALWRERLGSLSWFMRYLNEYVARLANREDGVTGRFWEGRFKSVALLDSHAVLGCMLYVDLNPQRAGIARHPGPAEHTSAHMRKFDPNGARVALGRLEDLGLSTASYLELLEWVAAQYRRGRVGPPRAVAQELSRRGFTAEAWVAHVHAHQLGYRAYGALEELRRYAKRLGQRWLRGARPGLAAPQLH